MLLYITDILMQFHMSYASYICHSSLDHRYHMHNSGPPTPAPPIASPTETPSTTQGMLSDTAFIQIIKLCVLKIYNRYCLKIIENCKG